MVGGSRKNPNKPHPSYEDGRLRDASIEQKQEDDYTRGKLVALIKKAARKPAKEG